jgi:hypothetical protein
VNVRAELLPNGRVQVSWDAVDGGGLAVSYTAQAVGVAFGGSVGTGGNGATAVTFADLERGGTYRFTVVARTAAATSAPSTPSPAVTIPGLPEAPTGLSAFRRNASGSLLVEVSWNPPPGPVPAAYQVTMTGSATGTTTERVTGTEYTDSDHFCSPTVEVTVRALDETANGGDEATTTVSDPVNCTPAIAINSAVANPDGTVTVDLNCSTGRGTVNSPFDLLFDGAVVDGARCTFIDGSGNDPHTFTVGGLDPDTEYTVTARVTSPSGSTTSNAVAVRTNP